MRLDTSKSKLRLFRTIVLSASFFLFLNSIESQQVIPVSKTVADAYVLEFKEPYNVISVDTDDATITTDEILPVGITPQTVFLNQKKKPLDRSLIRPGVELEIQGEKVGTKFTAVTVLVKTNVEKWAVKIEGYFEKLEGDTAKVDGQQVRLEKGAKIKGAEEWKSRNFDSFNDMMLGAEVKIDGVRKSDGIVYASRITTEPNTFSKNEREMRLKLSQGLLLPGLEQDDRGNVKKLSGGVVKMGGQEFKLVQDLAIQTYVNKVGNKLIPRYIKDLPRDDPSKLLFRFYVIENDSINAFAFADGSVFVNTGLLRILKNEAQMAGVLGHEIAHATYEHSRRGNDSMINQTIGVLRNNTKVLQDNSLITLGLGVLSNKFDRGMENQADRVGLMYMYDAGYDPREAPKVWRMLSSATRENSVENFLYSSHPLTRARLKNLNREIAYNYYQSDFSQALVKENEYRQVFGARFGWTKKPVRPQTPPAGGKPLTKTPPKTPKSKPKTKN